MLARRSQTGKGGSRAWTLGEQSTSAAETLCPACGMQRIASMPQLTSEGQQHVTALAQRYGVSTEAVLTLLSALMHGHGTMAQFDHRELGGRGQWMPGGMVMVGDMFNHALKAMVDGLCTELAALLAASPLVPAAPARSPMSSRATPHQQQGGGHPTADTQAPAAGSWGIASPPGGGGAWWPAELGMPAASGAQNAMRYAYFPAQRRLVIAVHEDLRLYDTLDHQVRGVSQQQGRSEERRVGKECRSRWSP